VRIDGFEEAAGDFADFAEGLRDVADNIDGAVDEGVKTTAFQIEGTAKRKAPADTGALRASIEARRLDIGAWVVGAKTEYAAAVELGTAPHVIAPDDADALAFEGQDGALIFRQRVEHPGTPAQPYLGPAFRAHESDLTQNISDEIEQLFARFL
jgi:HK97 gp10 family phage protein